MPACGSNTNMLDAKEVLKNYESSKSSENIYRVYLDKALRGSSYEIKKELKEILKNKIPADKKFVSELRKLGKVKEWLERDDNKSRAIFAIDPESCKDSYRHFSWNFRTDIEALDRAKSGCDKSAAKRNELLDKDCKCRLMAINNTFFYDVDEYKRHAASFPWLMLLEDGSRVKGHALMSNNQESYVLTNSKGIEICKGTVKFNQGSRGEVTIECYDGKLRGSGEATRIEFNKELRMYSGLANIKSNAGIIKVYYGPELVD